MNAVSPQTSLPAGSPRSSAAAQAATQAASTNPAGATQTGLNILLVDDEPDLAFTAGEALRDAGHRVTVASDGVEALGHVTSQVFDVIICDVRLPKLDGLTLFRRVRQESPDTDVILMTAFAEVPTRWPP